MKKLAIRSVLFVAVLIFGFSHSLQAQTNTLGPTGFTETAGACDSGTVNLSWNPVVSSSGQTVTYAIARAIADGSGNSSFADKAWGVKLSNTNSFVDKYTNSNLLGNKYFYSVSALFNGQNQSQWTNSSAGVSVPLPCSYISKFKIGDSVKPINSYGGLIYAIPGTSGNGSIGNIASGGIGAVIDGPRFVDGNVWWNIKWAKGPSGWTYESALSLSSTGQNSISKFQTGDKIQTTGGLKVRDSAGGTQIGTQLIIGTTGTVVSGPTTASLSGATYNWYSVDFGNGVDGWVVEDYLVPVSAGNGSNGNGASNSSAKFKNSDAIQLNSSANVRSAAAGALISRQVVGTSGSIVGGPTAASLNGVVYTWWDVDFSSGVGGWVAEDFITLSTTPIIQTSNPGRRTPTITSIDSTGLITPGTNVIVNGTNFDFANGLTGGLAGLSSSGVYVEIDGVQTVTPFYIGLNSLTFSLPQNVSVGTHKIRIGAKADYVFSNSFLVTVVASTTSNAPKIELYVNGARNSANISSGGYAIISWKYSNVSSGCTLGQKAGQSLATSPAGTGANGYNVYNITQNTTFTLYCDNGAASDLVQVNIAGSSQQTPTVTLSANPTTVNAGQPTTLNWSSTNATSCILLNSNDPAKYGDTTLSGTLTTYGTGVFTMTCSNSAGKSLPATVTISVNSNNQNQGSAPTVTLSASPATINLGGTTRLGWTNSADPNGSCTKSWVANSSTPMSGFMDVSPTQTTTYTITCTNPSGQKSSPASVTVTVNPLPVLPPTLAAFSFTASPTNISAGQSSTLTWSSTPQQGMTVSCTLANSNSNINQGTSIASSGSLTVSPTALTVYRVACMGSNGQGKSQDVTVGVSTTYNPGGMVVSTPISVQFGVGGTGVANWTITGGPTPITGSGQKTVSLVSGNTYTFTAGPATGYDFPPTIYVDSVATKTDKVLFTPNMYGPQISVRYAVSGSTSNALNAMMQILQNLSAQLKNM